MEYNSCDKTCTKKNALRVRKGVKHKAKLINCDKCDYSYTKNKVPVMHNFLECCDFICLTTGGLRFHQDAEHSGLEGSPGFKCALCDYTASKKYTLSKHRIREHCILNKINEAL